MKPTSYPSKLSYDITSTRLDVQIKLKDGGCPYGTVPIRRTNKEELTKMKMLLRQRKRYRSGNPNLISNPHNLINQWSIMTIKVGKYYGGAAAMNVYGLPNVLKTQGSSSLIWALNNGKQKRSNFIDAGWTVDPELFGDKKTRLVIDWTSDDHNQTGCYNILCPGFIQVNKEIPLGMAIEPLSTYNGTQYFIHILIFKDPKTNNWWLAYGKDKTFLGYWPSVLFDKLNDHAVAIDYGGVVAYFPGEWSPPMGNGHFPGEGPRRSCLFSNVKFVDEKFVSHGIGNYDHATYDSLPECYKSVQFNSEGADLGTVFGFGGPGGCKG